MDTLRNAEGMAITTSEPPPRARRPKVRVRAKVLDQATHHLGNFLTFLTSMSNAAVERAVRPEAKVEARRSFMQLFGEVVSTMAALDEAANPGGTAEIQAQLNELRDSREYRTMMAQMEGDRIAACYAFTDGVPKQSVMHPSELCFEVALKARCRDFGGWLISKVCTIDGVSYAVIAVEYAPLVPPFAAGDIVRLVVRPVTDDGVVADAPPPKEDHGQAARVTLGPSACAAGPAESLLAGSPLGGAPLAPG